MAKSEAKPASAGIQLLDFKYAERRIVIDAEIDTVKEVDAVVGFLGRMRGEIEQQTTMQDQSPLAIPDGFESWLAEAITEALYQQDPDAFDDSEDGDFSAVKLTRNWIDIRTLAKVVAAKLAEGKEG